METLNDPRLVPATRTEGDIVAPYRLPATRRGPAFSGLDMVAGLATLCMICGPLLAGVLRVG